MEETKINSKHKDRLFSFIFGREKNKSWTLELYNAMNHSSYDDPDDVEITTLENSVYMGMKNDVSFILYSSMNLYEHQSSINPNMPVRQLMYLAQSYDKFIKKNGLNVYGRTVIKLPVPKLITFYNGKEEAADETELSLSDMFMDGADASKSDVSVTVHMYNINYGHNKELLDTCRPLYEYAWVVDRIREYSYTMSIRDAVDKTLDEMPKNFEIREFLMENRSEVTMMCLTEYNEAETMASLKEEAHRMGLEEGIREGMQKGMQEGIRKGLEDGIQKEKCGRILEMLKRNKTPEEIADFCGYPIDLIRNIAKEHLNN